ncbi:universal stress protein [Methanoregula sp.]|uniref:universal stress protein n=1 Tax=Methanoregula sp. TaxID=2052170 RepID=UPI002C02185D|nr:universal stress protein [Methanoregula sp.]HVP95811.1 universal stress protein [Methanoregula sp.]
MFTNILVAIDGSKASDQAIERAVDEAKVWNARLHAIYVVETGLFSSLPSDNTVEIMYRVLENEGNAALEKAKKTAAKNGVALITHLKQGHAGTEIVALAQKEKVDLIISGSHGKSKTDSILLGSVSTYIATHSTVTTMVVRS